MSLKYEVRITYNEDLGRKYYYIEYRRYGIEHKLDGPAELWGDGFSKFYEYGRFRSQSEDMLCV